MGEKIKTQKEIREEQRKKLIDDLETSKRETKEARDKLKEAEEGSGQKEASKNKPNTRNLEPENVPEVPVNVASESRETKNGTPKNIPPQNGDWTNPEDKSIETYKNGIKVKTKHSDGTILEFFEDGILKGMVKKETTSEGVSREYNDKGKVIRYTNEDDETITYNYNDNGSYVGTFKDGSSFEYNDKGQKIKDIDEKGKITTYTYNNDNSYRATLPDGRVWEYDKNGTLIREINEKGKVEREYDEEGKIIKKSLWNSLFNKNKEQEPKQENPAPVIETQEKETEDPNHADDISDGHFEDVKNGNYTTPEGHKEYYEDGILISRKFSDGNYEEYDKSGKLMHRENTDGTVESFKQTDEDVEGETPEEQKRREEGLNQVLDEQEKNLGEKAENLTEKQKNLLTKTNEWWKGLDNSRVGRVGKLAVSTAFMGSVIMLSASTLGYAPTGSIAVKLGNRVAMAAGLNMLTSALPNKIKISENDSKFIKALKENATIENGLAVLGIGASFLLSGGLVGGVALGGAVARKIINRYADKNSNLKLNKALNTLLTLVVGITTVAVMHHQVEATQQEQQHLKDIHNKATAEAEKNWSEHDKQLQAQHDAQVKHDAEIKQQEDIKATIKEKMDLKEATIHKGEGIEHSFIRQIEHNPDLAKQLGFKGDISDTKALHEFTSHEAHKLALSHGFVSKTGEYVGVREADKFAYVIKVENGHPVIVEKITDTGETSRTYIEGDKFDTKLHQNEYIHSSAHEPTPPQNIVTENNDNHNATPESDFRTQGGFQHDNSILENWMRSPENIYNLSLDKLAEVRDLHEHNFVHLTHTGNLSDRQAANLEDTIKNHDASDIMYKDFNQVSHIYQPLWDYMHKLETMTGLHPREATLIRPGETNAEFILRAEMKVATEKNWSLDDLRLGE
jgi:YD repeat-containing protein